MNEIVKYENQFNAVALRKFNAVDLDFLMTLCYKFKEKGDMVIEIPFSEIRNLANYKQNANSDLVNDLKRMNEKLLGCHFTFTSPKEIVQFVLFTAFRINPEKEILTAKVNDEFAFLLNELDRNFTRFELNEFLSLRSGYAKECYRRLKQFRSTGKWIVEINEFRRLLDVPVNYTMSNIDKWVLKPIEKELTPLFNNLKITKIKKKGRGRGGVVDKIEFTFIPGDFIKNTEKEIDCDYNQTALTEDTIIKLGTYQNVEITHKDRDFLLSKMGKKNLENYIEKLSLHIKSTNKTYADLGATILKWWNEDINKGNAETKKVANKSDFKEREYDFDQLEKELLL